MRAARDILLEYVILDCAGQLLGSDTLLSTDGDIHSQQHSRRRVDRHRGRDFVERDRVEQDFHVGQRVDRHADLADLTGCQGVIAVVADLRRQVESHAQTGLPVFEQEAITLVGLFGGGESGILAHGPETRAIHARLYAAGKRILARKAEPVEIRRTGRFIRWMVESIDRPSGDGHRPLRLLGHLGYRLGERFFLPALVVLFLSG